MATAMTLDSLRWVQVATNFIADLIDPYQHNEFILSSWDGLFRRWTCYWFSGEVGLLSYVCVDEFIREGNLMTPLSEFYVNYT